LPFVAYSDPGGVAGNFAAVRSVRPFLHGERYFGILVDI